MYLTKIDLERASRRIQFALADCQQLHRLVGGMRASIYNAMPPEGIDKLVDFMEKFRREH